MTVGIVLVNYNGLKFQNDCIRTLYEMDCREFEIILVDNQSTDGSVEKTREEFPKVKILEMGDNLGVAKGNNVGIKYCMEHGYEYVLLLNNDTEADSKMLSELLKVAKESEKKIPVSKIYYYDRPNVLWFAGGEINWNRGITVHYGDEVEDKGQFDEQKHIEYAPTCCMLIPTAVFDKVDLVDEKTFMYYDDVDLCVRLNDAGYEITYVPTSLLWHKVNSSSGGAKSKIAIYYNNRNRFYFMNKHKEKFPKSAFAFTFFSRIIKVTFGRIKTPNNKYILEAYRDYKRGNMYRKDF